MAATRPLTLSLAALLAALLVAALSPAAAAPRARRQLVDDNSLQPLDDGADDEQTREKRKLEGITQAKFGIKNAVLGFVFGSGTTWRRLTPSAQSVSPALSTSSALSTSPVLSMRRPSPPPAQGTSPMLSIPRAPRGPRATTRDDDIPTFDRNKVSLDFPGNLFGPSVSLLIRTTKIIGDVIQNSAVRYQSFLRLFRPLFRGQFEIKGLDPITTTTTTTTTTTAAPITNEPPTGDNEVRRRRRNLLH